jgi:HJR/Mrr/RecB family endonuclease
VPIQLDEMLSARRTRVERAELAGLDDRGLGLRLEAAFWRLGYRVQRAREDPSGARLILAADGGRTLVQAGRFADEEAVRAAAAARERHRCEHALVVTASRAGPSARRLARSAGVKLLERRALLHLLASARRA